MALRTRLSAVHTKPLRSILPSFCCKLRTVYGLPINSFQGLYSSRSAFWMIWRHASFAAE